MQESENEETCLPSTGVKTQHNSNVASKEHCLKNNSSNEQEDGSTCNDHNQSIRPGVCGLVNIGNTCYMNSALQCLSSTPELRDYFYQLYHSLNDNSDNNIVNAFANIIYHIWSGRNEIYDPSTVKISLGKYTSRFKSYMVEDAHEFLNSLLNCLDENLHDKLCSSTTNIIKDLFHSEMSSTIICDKCKTSTTSIESIKFLPQPIPHNNDKQAPINIEACINLYIKPDKLGLLTCLKCGKQENTVQTFGLYSLAKILFIQLKRFKFYAKPPHQNKITSYIGYPIENLDLTNYVRIAQQNDSISLPTYNLVAVSVRSGSLGSGHYVTYALNEKDSQWYHFNDTFASRLDKTQSHTRRVWGRVSFYCFKIHTPHTHPCPGQEFCCTTSEDSFGSRVGL
ncbi:unnamed protein product [Rotaria socialis]|uniref:ubiquitinyl hydrolase 1 n=1 Tax=Rotaria socialis TaxID=392032 RepID=A0A817TVQ5_9BILA|nr:unnamed protein product [Rotaria socialis]